MPANSGPRSWVYSLSPSSPRWTAIAWPRAANSGGNRTMFTNQSGDILATRDTVYAGKDTDNIRIVELFMFFYGIELGKSAAMNKNRKVRLSHHG